ncbi:Predicted nucleotidyltransferase [Amphibacillus marinus]|uniref:tRNA(Met) cytidine acetate ligase n=1 Tax=Amphibacillus marinus TaxID=872970 RepID=A0A1H8I6A5_9BACI|nr:nucleotidyltransferase [Amphibacillus marinus]SEN63999.1 Predicted nucleotidyltransferase [Amphibacillus marinus]
MKAVGIIVEYNPFHNGHLYHIEQARVKSNADIVIAIMSGQFLQRGEPAIVDKFTRAKMAIAHGADLVVELPTIYAIQHSDIFAYAAVYLLNCLQVDFIIFGSEAGLIEPFYKIAEIECEKKPTYQALVKASLKQGLSYPHANQLALATLIGKTELDLKLPNNILGLSYLKAQQQINRTIKLETIKRKQASYHEASLSQPIASATAIRNYLFSDNPMLDVKDLSMPNESIALLNNYREYAGLFHTWDDYFPLLKYRLLTDTLEQLSMINGMTEGLEYRLKKQINQSKNFNDFLSNVLTKRYTKARLQRLFLHVLLNLTTETVHFHVNNLYTGELNDIRLLAMTKAGQLYLNFLKPRSEVTFIGQLKKNSSATMAIDANASAIYYLPITEPSQTKLRHKDFSPPHRQ